MTDRPVYSLGAGSELRLRGVHESLVRVVHRAIRITAQDFSVVYGVRSQSEQAHLVALGASKNPNSAHLYGRAVDLVPYLGPGVDPYPRKGETPAQQREKLARFEAVARAMFEAADELHVPLQWGNDWDCDGIPTTRDPDEKGWLPDMPHFQLPPAHREDEARARAVERAALRQAGREVIS